MGLQNIRGVDICYRVTSGGGSKHWNYLNAWVVRSRTGHPGQHLVVQTETEAHRRGRSEKTKPKNNLAYTLYFFYFYYLSCLQDDTMKEVLFSQ